MSTPGVPPASAPNRRQKRMGPAPFASFEDLSDELESPEDKNTSGSVVRLPGIREDITPCSPVPQDKIKPEFIYTGISLIGAPSTPTMTSVPSPTTTTHAKTNLQPSAPRIDISRASSSSHHDSKDSSPEREIYEPQTKKMGLGFKEEGTLDLRSSTEELDYQDPEAKQNKLKQQPIQPPRPLSPLNDSYHSHNRKDSQSSEIGLLCISGRTSRLSSIGSQGSAQSRASNASHLSIISGQSALSRSPSPHKMLLETSFCGTKPRKDAKTSQELDGTKVNEDLEKVLLQRNHDMTQALFAEGITMDQVEEIKIRYKPPEKPKIKPRPNMQTIKSDVTITVDKPAEVIKKPEEIEDLNIDKPKLPKRIISASGVEYIYIPLKGPLPVDPAGTTTSSSSTTKYSYHSNTDKTRTAGKTKVRETKSASLSTKSGSKTREPTKSKSASPSPMLSRHHAHDEPKYIRIKLKPDHCYDESRKEVTKPEIQKPTRLDLNQAISEVESIALENNKLTSRLEANANERKHSAQDEIKIVKPVVAPVSPNLSPMLQRTLAEPPQLCDSKTPSPSISRKSSFASLFRSRENISPETPSTISTRRKSDRSRSRSKSRERSTKSSNESIDSKGKSKPTVLSLFKTKKSGQNADLPNLATLCNLESKLTSELPKKKKREHQLQGESIRIPLHSPTYYETKNLLQDHQKSSQDSQDTVIEVKTSQSKESVIEEVPNNVPKQTPKPDYKARQSSTSSENIVFSTKLGSNNDLFTTKLPKSPKEKPKPIEIEKVIEKKVVTSKIIKPLELDIKPTKEIRLEKSVTEVFSSEPEPVLFTELTSVRKITKKLISKDLSKDSFDKYTDNFASTSKETVIINTKSFELESKSFDSEKDTIISENGKPNFATFSTDYDLRKGGSDIIDSRKFESNDFGSSKFVTENFESNKFSTDFESNFDKTPSDFDKTPVQKLQKSIARDDSETDSEQNFDIETKETNKKDINDDCIEIERKGLVFQTDSFDDEIPYIPTTLPQERTMGVAIVPVKQRSTFEMKTCSINRPRSTTPIHLSCLEQYCDDQLDDKSSSIEKIKITLPGEDGVQKRVKSPKKPSHAVAQFDFIPKKKDADDDVSEMIRKEAQDIQQKEWVNFEEIPERRKPPKRIQTIPSRSNIEVPEPALHQHNVIYTYVNPEDCKCECHHDVGGKGESIHIEDEPVREDEQPLLEDDAIDDRMKLDVTILDRRSVVSDSSLDLSTTVEPSDANGVAHSLQTPFTSDLGISSNRSSIISQDDPQSPDTESPNAFPKT